MSQPSGRARLTHILLLLLPLALGTSPARALLMVDGTVKALGGGVWQYDFTIGNTGPEDVILVSLLDAPVDDPLIAASLTAPVGFQASYDSNAILDIAFMDFLEDTLLFAVGSSVGLFSFESQAAPGTAFTLFEAIELDFDTIAGNTRLTVIDNDVPLPGTLYLALAALTLLAGRRLALPPSGAAGGRP